MQYKDFPFDVKVDLNRNEFEGYASVFGNVDAQGDIIEKGAFAKTIKERMHKKLIKVLWQHFEPMGLPKHLEEDSKGLYAVAKVTDTRENQDRLALMRDGVVDRMSIGYSVIKRELEEPEDGKEQVVRLKEVKLFEFSPVTFAANEEAVVLGVKTLAQLDALLKQFPDLDLLKEGRVLSSSNRAKVEAAIEALQALLDAASQPEKSTGEGEQPPPADIDPEFIQSMLASMRQTRKRIGG